MSASTTKDFKPFSLRKAIAHWLEWWLYSSIFLALCGGVIRIHDFESVISNIVWGFGVGILWTIITLIVVFFVLDL